MVLCVVLKTKKSIGDSRLVFMRCCYGYHFSKMYCGTNFPP